MNACKINKLVKGAILALILAVPLTVPTAAMTVETALDNLPSDNYIVFFVHDGYANAHHVITYNHGDPVATCWYLLNAGIRVYAVTNTDDSRMMRTRFCMGR